MKFYFSLFLFLFGFGFSLSAQVLEGSVPESFRGKIKPPKSYFKLPAINSDSLIIAGEQARAQSLEKRLQFGFEHAVSIDFFEKASKTTLPNGETVYQFGVECPDALSLNFIFSQFNLAQGVRLYIADAHKLSFVGAYTSLNNNEANALGTELIYTSKAIIEIIEPIEAKGKSSLTISTIVHGFIDLDHEMEKALGQAGNCNVDVNCPLGSGWESQRNSVACVVSGGGACTGSLVNNTSGSIIPYYLSANHCGTNPTNWVFRFRWERTAANAICAQTNSTANNGPTNMTVNGGVLRASNSGSDFILVELNTAPNPAWGIYYNGWDNTDALTVTQGTGIHHPRGDIKKICREDDPLTQQVTPFNGNPNTNVWRVNNWDQGVTEPASSGSPLFDQNKRVVGVLSGGSAACNGFTDNGGYDIYGRFGVAWDQGSTPATRLKEWLDPGNTGATVIDGVDPNGPQPENDGGLVNPTGVSGRICGTMVYPKMTITNTGTNPMTAAVISYGFDGNIQFTYNWSGNLAQFENEIIELPGYMLSDGDHSFQAKITSVNQTADENNANNELNTSLTIVDTGEPVILNLNLDHYASETSWKLVNNLNETIYSGGNYSDGGSGTTLLTQQFCLKPGCYAFKIYDEFSDGLTSDDFPNGSFQIVHYNGTLLTELLAADADFGDSLIKNFCFQSTANLNENVLANQTTVFPNPAQDELTIKTLETAQIDRVSLIDLTGKTILAATGNQAIISIHLQGVASGMYTCLIETNLGIVRKNVVVR